MSYLDSKEGILIHKLMESVTIIKLFQFFLEIVVRRIRVINNDDTIIWENRDNWALVKQGISSRNVHFHSDDEVL